MNSSRTRQQMWDTLGEPVDLLVIGGGINGAGIARDAARRGLKVALVEARDLAYGTSSRSSKLVHGGLRYLQQFEFSLVFEAVSERRILLDIAPHLVRPLGFLFPVYRDSPHNLLVLKAGMWLYEGLSLFRSPKRHRKLSVRDIATEEPALTREHLKGAPLYYDCSTDDARLTLESALDAIAHGATVATWTRALSFIKDEETGRIQGAVVKDMLGDGALKEIRAHAVINATGPWTDRTRALSAEPTTTLLRPTKGVHIVVDHHKLPVNNAVVCFHPDDKRVLFAIPWGEQTYIGTTDTDFSGDPGQVYADCNDVDYLLTAANDYFPEHPLTPDDVIATWAGLRPLIAPPRAPGSDISESEVSREHQIIIGEDGLITIAGGKLTTYRRMSAEVVETAIKFLRLADQLPEELHHPHTDTSPLPGAREWPEAESDEAAFNIVATRTLEASAEHLSEATAYFLAHTYGTRAPELAALVAEDPLLAEPICPDRPEILAQINWAIQRELAATLTDMLVQRTQIFYRAADQGRDAAPRVARHMAPLLGWDEATIAENIDRYLHDVDLSQRWRTEHQG
ncbi:glycerol-3-phosphate dehydrogenase [Lujinxingia litoralis]|uniref:Glycerol-3-phosphate dehydrogenase n=1 Tax=Lujinxingia litoralis TaxID=2211119 RepID=A0A328C801_9DELT|nr:glycerol-3-phosphate dehydrogenase [Lujinxingia litoralis]RAL20708.1 glycerol-3-phosphate dehydrogenase [Lujinxingia litoralis]